MGLKIGDMVRFEPILSGQVPTETTNFSNPISMAGFNEFAVLLTAHNISSAALAAPILAKLLAGTTTFASQTAYASVAGSSFVVLSSGTTHTKLTEGFVCINGTATKATQAFVLDGTTFRGSNTANSSIATAITVHTTNTTGAAAQYAAYIKAVCTYLETTVVEATATTNAYVYITSKDKDRTFSLSAAGAGILADNLTIMPVTRSAMFEFKSEDINQIMSTVSTLAYTHVAVRVSGTLAATGVANVHGFLAMGGARFAPFTDISRGQLSTVSANYSS